MRNGLKLEGCRSIARKYKELFMEKGLTTAQGVRYLDRIKTAFTEYHGEGFLKQLFQDKENYLYWLDFVFESVSEHLRPLHHILLMEFLKETAQGFFLLCQTMSLIGMAPGRVSIRYAVIMEKTGQKKYPSSI